MEEMLKNIASIGIDLNSQSAEVIARYWFYAVILKSACITGLIIMTWSLLSKLITNISKEMSQETVDRMAERVAEIIEKKK